MGMAAKAVNRGVEAYWRRVLTAHPQERLTLGDSMECGGVLATQAYIRHFLVICKADIYCHGKLVLFT